MTEQTEREERWQEYANLLKGVARTGLEGNKWRDKMLETLAEHVLKLEAVEETARVCAQYTCADNRGVLGDALDELDEFRKGVRTKEEKDE